MNLALLGYIGTVAIMAGALAVIIAEPIARRGQIRAVILAGLKRGARDDD